MAKQNNTKVVTGIVRLSYANVWEPKSINGGDPKYSCYCGEGRDVPAERVRAGLCNGRLICLSLLPNSRVAGRCAGIPSFYIGGSSHYHLYSQGQEIRRGFHLRARAA